MYRLLSRLVSFSVLAVVVSFSLVSCTPVTGGSGSVQPLVEPGSTCSPAQRGMWQNCLGSDGVSVCAFQVCDLITNVASSCFEVTCPATVPLPVPGTPTGSGQCDPPGAVNLSCTTADGTLRPGYQYCDVANRWGACVPYAGTSHDSGVPSSFDGGMNTACNSDPEVVGAVPCSAGLGICRGNGVWTCNLSNVKVCSASANEAARGSEGVAPDGFDNDCDGIVDNNISRSCFPFPTGNPGVGVCQYGTQNYNPATVSWSACVGAIGPSIEVPDNLIDEDCNGGLLYSVRCGGDARVGTPCSAGIGSCMDMGTFNCVGTELICDAVAGLPSPEVCDGFDNDCDGGIDGNVESCYTGRAGSAGIGACRAGNKICRAGVFSTCSGEVLPALEVCGNATDEDCNGFADSCVVCGSDARVVPVPLSCSEGIGACQRSGTYTCAAGVVACNVAAGAATSEVCNGIDDDCDGSIDESVVQTCASYSMSQAGRGVCMAGTQACIGYAGAPVWGFCTGEVRPQTEICGDGIDQDCNGTDLLCSPGCGGTVTGGSCTFGRGRCASPGTLTCVGGTSIQCVPAAPALDPIGETCNGIDDNCDGVVDNDAIAGGPLTQPCYPFGGGTPGLGACTNGAQTCVAGAFSACFGAAGPTAEVCDGIDNNCNGGIDEFLSCGDAGTPAADAGVPSADAGPVALWTESQTTYCRAGRVASGYTGVVSASLDLLCVNSIFGTCLSGWMLTIKDQNDCDVPSSPGVLAVSMDLANVSSGIYRLGLWCGSTDARVWPAPRNVAPRCVTSFITAGVNRTSAGTVCPGPIPSSGLLPEFPANPAAPAVTCP